MKIGIKYCGGCNPRYDRTDIVRRLRGDMPGAEIVSAVPGAELDYAVIVCGCTSACADADGIMGKHGRMLLTSGNAYEELLERLKQL